MSKQWITVLDIDPSNLIDQNSCPKKATVNHILVLVQTTDDNCEFIKTFKKSGGSPFSKTKV